MHVLLNFQFYGFLSSKAAHSITCWWCQKHGKTQQIREILWSITNGLSKIFDCLSHKLLIAKFYAYGYNLPSPKLIQTNSIRLIVHWRKFYLECHEDLFMILVFHIFLCDCDLFWIMSETDFSRDAGDNTSYVSGDNI